MSHSCLIGVLVFLLAVFNTANVLLSVPVVVFRLVESSPVVIFVLFLFFRVAVGCAGGTGCVVTLGVLLSLG